MKKKKKSLKQRVMKEVRKIAKKAKKAKRKLPPQAHHVVTGKFVTTKYAKAHPDKVEWVKVKC